MFHKNNKQDVKRKKPALTQREKINPVSLAEFELLTDTQLRTLLAKYSMTLKSFAPFDELKPVFGDIDRLIETASTTGLRNAVFFATGLVTLWEKFQPEEPPFKAFPKVMLGPINTSLSNIESALKSELNLDNAPYRMAK